MNCITMNQSGHFERNKGFPTAPACPLRIANGSISTLISCYIWYHPFRTFQKITVITIVEQTIQRRPPASTPTGWFSPKIHFFKRSLLGKVSFGENPVEREVGSRSDFLAHDNFYNKQHDLSTISLFLTHFKRE